MTLAGASDVATELGLENEAALTPVQARRIPTLLVKASYLFRKAAQRQFAEGPYTHRLKVQGGRVRLPEGPISAVAAVVDDSGNTVTFTRNGDWLTVEGHHNHQNSFDCYRPTGGSDWFVTATYTGGGVPDVVKVAVAQTVAAALQQDPRIATGARRVETESGPFRERVEFVDGGSATLALSDDDRELAESFRYPGTQVIVQTP